MDRRTCLAYLLGNLLNSVFTSDSVNGSLSAPTMSVDKSPLFVCFKARPDYCRRMPEQPQKELVIRRLGNAARAADGLKMTN